MVGGELMTQGAQAGPATLLSSCGSSPGLTCQLVWDVSHNERAAAWTSAFLSGPVHLLLRVAFVVLLAFVIRWLVRRVIDRLTERATSSLLPQLRGRPTTSRLASSRLVLPGRRDRGRRRERERAAAAVAVAVAELTGGGASEGGASEARASEARASEAGASEVGRDADTTGAVDTAGVVGTAGPPETEAERGLVDERRKQRVRALGAILHSASAVIIFSIAGVIILGDLDINLAPLLASAGVVGIAIGFGAQTLVRDYLAGVFMLVEDQYGVGDVVTIGEATGSVENVTLRITRLRDLNGIVWHIRNGSIEQVGNESQGWARAVVDYPVPHEPDLARISAVLAAAARTLWDDPAWRAVMLEPPEVWGAQEITTEEVTMRIVAKTAPLRQWGVEREMRARVKAALSEAGLVGSG